MQAFRFERYDIMGNVWLCGQYRFVEMASHLEDIQTLQYNRSIQYQPFRSLNRAEETFSHQIQIHHPLLNFCLYQALDSFIMIWLQSTFLSRRMIARIKRHFTTQKIVFFGSGRVAEPSLKAIIDKLDNVQVISHFTPPHRKTTNEVQILCKNRNIKFVTPITDHTNKQNRKKEWEAFKQKLKMNESNNSLGVVCSYGFMIPSSIIELFNKGIIVVHPSLLPKYRGGAPIFHTIVNGQSESGVSFIEISKGKYDNGNILHQVKCKLNLNSTYLQTQKQLAQLAGENILSVIQSLDTYRPGVPQDKIEVQSHLIEARIYRSKKLNLNQDALKVYNWSRALETPRLTFNGIEIIVNFYNQTLDDQFKQEVGKLKLIGKKLFIKCKDKYLRLNTWKEISKKQLPIYTFIDRFIRNKTQQEYPSNFKMS